MTTTPPRKKRRRAFWRLASRMCGRRRALITAVVMAFLSALSLGGGLLAMAPILRAILMDEGGTLPELAQRFNEKSPIDLSDSLIAALPDGRFDAVLWMLIGVVGLTVFGATMNVLHAYFALTVSTETVAAVRRDVFRHVISLPMRAVVGRTGEVGSLILNDTNVLLTGFNAILSKALAQITKSVAALAAAMALSWRITIVAALVAPILYVIIRKLGKRVRRASKGALRAQGDLLSTTNEALGGLRLVKAHRGERHELGRFSGHNARFVREQFRARAARAFASPLMETLMVVVIAILAMIAAKAIIDGALDPMQFIAALTALAFASSALKPLTAVVQQVQTSEAAATRLLELLELAPEYDRRAARRAGLVELPRHSESIEFDRATFTYDGAEEPSVRDVTLRIPHGRTVAFVGPNGSGKTTLLSLLPRFFDPDEGAVRVDGVDLQRADLRSLRDQLGVVTQEVVLFKGTIASNIAYARPGATPEEIEHAARQAGAHEFIVTKPGGYDAVVGESGLTLSGGQRQRLAIARAILRDPAILILDEATSMVDAESERRIAEAIGQFSAGRTVLVVAHRLSTVLGADLIVVMDAGRVVDVGTHDTLIDRSDVYARIARTQLAPAGA